MTSKEKNVELSMDDMPSVIEGLKLLQPGRKQQKDELFAILYPAIKDALARSVTQTAILKFLKERGLALSPNTFRKMLAAEMKREQEAAPMLGAQLE